MCSREQEGGNGSEAGVHLGIHHMHDIQQLLIWLGIVGLRFKLIVIKCNNVLPDVLLYTYASICLSNAAAGEEEATICCSTEDESTEEAKTTEHTREGSYS